MRSAHHQVQAQAGGGAAPFAHDEDDERLGDRHEEPAGEDPPPVRRRRQGGNREEALGEQVELLRARTEGEARAARGVELNRAGARKDHRGPPEPGARPHPPLRQDFPAPLPVGRLHGVAGRRHSV